MSATVKRTRSQLTVPDGILQLPLSRSPLKEARTTLRNQSRPRPELRSVNDTQGPDMEETGDSEEDEILLSPRKKQKTWATTTTAKKRPSSPFDDLAQLSKSGGGRDRKRPRRDSASPETAYNLSNIENTPHNDSRLTPIHATTNNRKPVSASAAMEGRDQSTNSATRTPRAQSVPLYTTQIVPHIDLRKVSPSPWRSPTKQRRDTAWITRLGQLNLIPDVPQHAQTDTETAEGSQSQVGITVGGICPLSSTQSEPDVTSTHRIEDVEDMEVDASAAAPSIPTFNSNTMQRHVTFDAIHSDATPLTTPRPLNLDSWPEMSPLTPLLETPYPRRTDQGPEDTINDIQLDVDSLKGPTEEKHLTAAAELPSSEINPASTVHGATTAQTSLGRTVPSKPLAEVSASTSNNIKAKISQATSLAKVLGPRTAAKISISHPFTTGSSSAFAGFARSTFGVKPAPALSRAPSEKLKAKMKMREKPLTSFSFTKTKAPTGARLTRSLATKKARARSASVDLGERVHAARMSVATLDSNFDILDVKLFMTNGVRENPVTQKPADKQSGVAPVASTSNSTTKPVSNHSRAATPSDTSTLAKPRTSEFTSNKPVSPSKPKPNSPTKPSTSLKTESTRQTTLRGHIRSTVTSPTKASLARAAATILPSSSTASKPKLGPNLAPLHGTSSLVNLSNALEKLNVPRPVRPNSNLAPRPSTSMGFNRESAQSGKPLDETQACAVDDGVIKRDKPDMSGLGIGKTGLGLRRAVTLGSESFRSGQDDFMLAESSNPAASSSEDGGTGTLSLTATSSEVPADVIKSSSSEPTVLPPRTGQTSLTAWMSAGPSRATGSHISGSLTKPPFFVPGTRMAGSRFGTTAFGAGIGRGVRKVSRVPGLPSVIGSPVKGQSSNDSAERPDDEVESRGLDFITEASPSPHTGGGGEEDMETIFLKATEKKDAKSSLWSKETFKRASLASQALSQSLNEVRTGIVKGSMDPPPAPAGTTETPPGEGSSPATAPNRALRSSTRISAAIANSKLSSGLANNSTNADASSNKTGQKSSREDGNNVTLSILKGCTVFVDVRTDDGDDAGALFVQMLRGMGARILARVGQSCTHIVFKNGLLSTLTRYRLLNDPKPKVVGIAWVVECVEQRQRVDELKFKVELNGMNVAGVNKRRRSMLPKHIPKSFDSDEPNPSSREPEMVGDVSFSVNDLAPLEKARMRKALLPSGSSFKQ